MIKFLNLQRFAEEQEPQESDEKITFTEEQQKLINSMIEQRVARERQKTKDAEAERLRKEQQDKEEAQRLERMSEKERTDAEMAKLKNELEAFKAKSKHTEMMDATRKEVQARGYTFSDPILSAIVCDSAEETKSRLDAFVSEFEKAVSQEVKKAVKANPPKAPGDKATLTKEQILSVKNTQERQKLINENLHLFV